MEIQTRAEAYDSGEIVDCARFDRCERTFLAVVAVRDPDEVHWRGQLAASFCSQDCLDKWTEAGDP